MQNIVLLSNNTVLAGDLKRRLNSDDQLSCQVFTYRTEVVEHITIYQVDGLVMMDLENSRDIGLILKGVKFSLNPNATKVVILSSDLSQAAEFYQAFEDLNIKILSLHESPETIVKEIRFHINEEVKQKIVTESKKTESVTKTGVEKGTFNMNMEFLKVFIDAAKDVVFQMSGDDSITHERPIFLSQMNPPPKIGIRGRIEIVSEHFSGSLFISFPKDTYLSILESILGEKLEEIDENAQDFILELANIVYGQSKRILNSSGLHLEMKIPEYYKKEVVSDYPVFVIPYTSKFGDFYIKVAPNFLR